MTIFSVLAKRLPILISCLIPTAIVHSEGVYEKMDSNQNVIYLVLNEN